MENMTKVAIALIGLLLVGGGIMLAIYLLNGGEGESTNIPGNPSEVVTLRLG